MFTPYLGKWFPVWGAYVWYMGGSTTNQDFLYKLSGILDPAFRPDEAGFWMNLPHGHMATFQKTLVHIIIWIHMHMLINICIYICKFPTVYRNIHERGVGVSIFWCPSIPTMAGMSGIGSQAAPLVASWWTLVLPRVLLSCLRWRPAAAGGNFSGVFSVDKWVVLQKRDVQHHLRNVYLFLAFGWRKMSEPIFLQ